jgi:hypothetical protein
MPPWTFAPVRTWSQCVASPREEGVEPDRELILEDAR